jgi:hypothetical protein
MELIELAVLVLIVGAVAGATYALTRRATVVRANSPPGALVEPDDPVPVVRAKNRTYYMLLDAVRIFQDILRQDDQVPCLSKQVRAEVEHLLAAFYDNR